MNKCSICGKKAITLTQLCSECMQKAAVEPEQMERIKQLDGILNLTAGGNIKEGIESLVEVTKELKGGIEK